MPECDHSVKAIIEAPTDRPVKIVAGAGTGKTYTLTHRFLWLLEQGYRPSDVLAITFTEKAADEMRSRIRAAMAHAGAPGETALNVHTFHGFGRRLLREYAGAAGVSPDVKVLDEVQQRAVQRRLFRDACAGRADMDGLRVSDLSALDVKSLDDFERFCRTVIAKGKGHGWSPDEFTSEAQQREDSFWNALPSPAAVEDTGYQGELTEFLYSAMRQKFPCRPFDDADKKSGDARKVYWTQLNNSKGLVPEMRDGLADLFHSQRHATLTVLRFAVAFWRLYDDELRRLGALDYDDLINRSVGLLRRTPEVRADVLRRFRYLLVDEFQDTSPAQMELLRYVCVMEDCSLHRREQCGCNVESRPLNVTVVGDKKQAIYAWRNARKENMDEFVPCRHEDTLKRLTTSRRCSDKVRLLANAIAHSVEPDDPALEAPAEPERPTEVHVPQPFEADRIGKAREKAARYIAERIQWMAGGEGGERRAYRDIAILLRKTTLFRELRAAFRERNIPYAFESATGLMEEPCAKDAVAFLRAVATPQDDAAWYRLLNREPVGLSDAELVRLKPSKDEHFEDTVQTSSEARVTALLQRVETARAAAADAPLKEFLRRLPVSAAFIEAWGDDDREVWPQVLAALEAAADQAEALQPGAGVQDLIELLDTYADDDNLQMPTPPTEFAGVRVMTVHKAKGLEFPVVFVPDIETKGRTDTGWVWDDDWGVIPDLSSGDSVKGVFWKWLRTRDAREDEEARVWYVAATRAKDSLTVTGTWSPSGKEVAMVGDERHAKAIEKSTLPSVFGDGEVWGLASHTLEPVDWDGPPRRRVRRNEPPETDGPVAAGSAGVRSITTSYSAMSVMDFCPVLAWLDFHWAWPEALLAPFESGGRRRLGDLFHLAVARWYNGLRDGLPDAVFGAGDTTEARDELRGLWDAFLESEWKDIQPVAVERAVTYRTEVDGAQVELRGYVDLLYRDAEGRLVVCDFKTGASSAAHATQLCLYRLALSQEGQDVAEEGVAIHPRTDGVVDEPFRLPDHESEVHHELKAYVALITGDTPASPDSAPCDRCRYREACPGSSWQSPDPAGGAAPALAEADLFEPEWLPVVAALTEAGWDVDEPPEVGGRLAALLVRRGGVEVVVWPEGAVLPESGGRHVAGSPAAVAALIVRLEEML